MLQIMVFSHNQVSSFKTVRSRATCGPDVKGTFLRRGLCYVQLHRTRNPMKEQERFLYGQIESSNISLKTIELDPNCSGQTHSNRPGTDTWYENMEHRCIFAVLHVPFLIHSLRSACAKSSKVNLIDSAQFTQTGFSAVIDVFRLFKYPQFSQTLLYFIKTS